MIFITKRKIYLEVLSLNIAIIYMQYSKFKWILSKNNSSFIELIRCVYPELFFVSLITYILIIVRRKNEVFIFFIAIYYLTIFNYSSWFIQGRPFLPSDIYRSIQLFIYYPEFLNEIELVLKIKLLLFTGLPLLVFGVAKCQEFLKPEWSVSVPKRVRKAILAILSTIIVLSPVGLYANIFHYSTVVEIMKNTLYYSTLKHLSTNPDAAYRAMGNVDSSGISSSFFDFHSKNVLLFIIETAPYDVYPSLGDLCQVTSNTWLSEHGRIYENHYTPYPESERAIYSIVSGRYPFLKDGDDWKKTVKNVGLAGFFNGLGYETYFLGTAPLDFHDDRKMIQGLGFQNIYNVKETLSARKIIAGKAAWDRSKIYQFDNILIDKALNLIADHASTDSKPFFMVLAPQSSHAPFQVPPGSLVAAKDDREKIELNAVWQFTLIKKLIQKLEMTGALKDTVVVITGDHGIRSKYESALFSNPKLLQSISFHVPLLIAASETEPETVDSYVTSHVDIAKTIASSFGAGDLSHEYHGVNLFSSHLPQRSVFLFGGGYLPVSGMINKDGFFMENRFLEMFFNSRTFDFSENSRISLNKNDKKYFLNEMMSVKSILLQ